MHLSVIVTIVDAGEALERCLEALATQHDPLNMEVLVPWDDSIPGIPALAGRFPSFRFLPMGRVETRRPAAGAAGQHELYDRRRSAGLTAAGGDVIAMLEDRGVPRPTWARTMRAAHEHLPHAVIGGAIENGRDSLLHWAVYFCDFGRFGRPFDAGPRRWVSDINIGYKRRALEKTREVWRHRYHETSVHWALRRAGETLYLSEDPIVDQMRMSLTLGALLVERFAWGRLFASTRAREMSVPARLTFAALSPLLPLLLLARHARMQIPRRAGTFLAAAPATLALLMVWSAGEAVGYVTASA